MEKMGSKYHSMVWVGKDNLVPTLLFGLGHLPLVQVTQSHIKPGQEYLQGWGVPSLSGQQIVKLFITLVYRHRILRGFQVKNSLPFSPRKRAIK